MTKPLKSLQGESMQGAKQRKKFKMRASNKAKLKSQARKMGMSQNGFLIQELTKLEQHLRATNLFFTEDRDEK